MTHVTDYGNRQGPNTWDKFVPIVAALFKTKAVVSLADIQTATKRKWVHGFMASMSKTVEPIVPVRVGRKTVGYRLESKPLKLTKNGSFRDSRGRFVKLAA